ALGFISFREGEGSVTCRRRRITEISSLTPVDVHIAHARLYVERIFEVQYPEGRLHQVTTKIAKGTGTIVPPSPPALGNDLVCIVAVRCGAEPQIPRKSTWHGRFRAPGNSLRPNRTVCEDLNGMDVANNSGVIPFHQLPHTIA